MVSGLVKQENVGVLEDGAGERELHLPTTRQGADGRLEHGIGEPDTLERLDDLVTVLAGELWVVDNEVDDGSLGVRAVDVMLDVDGAELFLGRETFDLLVGNSAHEGGLAGTVGTAETVATTTLEVEGSAAEQNLGTVGERELALAEILAFLVVLLLGRLGPLGEERSGDGLSLGLSQEGDKVGRDGGGPRRGFEVFVLDQLEAEGGDVGDGGSEEGINLAVGFEDGLEGFGDVLLGELGLDGGLLDVTVLVGAANPEEGSVGLGDNGAALRVGDLVLELFEPRKEFGKERSGNGGALDKLGHVIDNDSSETADGVLALVQTTGEDGNHDDHSGSLDGLNECGGTELADAGRDLLRVGDAADESWDELLNVLVRDEATDCGHGSLGRDTNFILGVPHTFGHKGDNLGNMMDDLLRSSLDEDRNKGEGAVLGLPLARVFDASVEGGKEGFGGVGVEAVHDGVGGDRSSGPDGSLLVRKQFKDGGEEGEEIGLVLVVGGQGGDSSECGLAGLGIFFVVELSREGGEDLALVDGKNAVVAQLDKHIDGLGLDVLQGLRGGGGEGDGAHVCSGV
ncbi:hypothetical protein BC936DRAFT_144571 [Jimgerdemannia flammicorona]|uniref:Uncharacterized protein n=1 Tax=Jimgerdemannia flammicorona TaxID=994334 RepID=A0A433DC57_9FUNG|nr:hypothetical protein BC936DRAFT_144571 [Jimgerdemannia flammicorona]